MRVLPKPYTNMCLHSNGLPSCCSCWCVGRGVRAGIRELVSWLLLLLVLVLLLREKVSEGLPGWSFWRCVIV
jgi:hypothetical protein